MAGRRSEARPARGEHRAPHPAARRGVRSRANTCTRAARFTGCAPRRAISKLRSPISRPRPRPAASRRRRIAASGSCIARAKSCRGESELPALPGARPAGAGRVDDQDLSGGVDMRTAHRDRWWRSGRRLPDAHRSPRWSPASRRSAGAWWCTWTGRGTTSTCPASAGAYLDDGGAADRPVADLRRAQGRRAGPPARQVRATARTSASAPTCSPTTSWRCSKA